MVELGVVDSLSHESVRLHLKKHPQAVAEKAAEYSQGERGVRGGHGGRAGDLYAEPYDLQRPVICFDEISMQLLAETWTSLPTKPGRPRREDYEYVVLRQAVLPVWGHLVLPFSVVSRNASDKADRKMQRWNTMGLQGL